MGHFYTAAVAPHAAVLKRELRTLLRSPQVFAGVGAFAGLLGLMCTANFPYPGMSASQFGVLYAKSMVGLQLFGLWLAALAALPAMAVLGLHRDVQSGTLEQFACTPLRPRAYYWSKAAALALVYLAGTAAVLPVSGIAFFLAGVEVRPYLGQLATLLCFAACMLAVSLQIAARVSATLPALFRTLAIGLTAGGGAILLFTGYHLGAATLYILAFTVAVLLIPAAFRRAVTRNTERSWFESAQRNAPAAERPALEFPDGVNPITVKDRLLFQSRLRAVRRRRGGLFLMGFLLGILPYTGMLGFMATFIQAAGYLFSLLLYGTGAVIVAALFFQDCDRTTMDALRGSLLSEREFLYGKIRVAWRMSVPLLAGWGAGATIAILYFSGALRGFMTDPVAIVLQFVFVVLVLPRFHVTLLLAAAGATFGRNALTSIASALACSAAGHLLLSLAGRIMGRVFFTTVTPQTYAAQLMAYGTCHVIVLGAALGAALLFARWRISRLWRAAGG